MRRGSTPTNTFHTNVDLSGATVYVTYTQRGAVVVEKTGDDLVITQDSVVTALTQEDTLSFHSDAPVEMQIRYVFPDGTAGASNIITTTVLRILKDGVIHHVSGDL